MVAVAVVVVVVMVDFEQERVASECELVLIVVVVVEQERVSSQQLVSKLLFLVAEEVAMELWKSHNRVMGQPAPPCKKTKYMCLLDGTLGQGLQRTPLNR